ncbi:MAG: hypothetical protein EOP04_26495, partial [Proteobacteria bacterium]
MTKLICLIALATSMTLTTAAFAEESKTETAVPTQTDHKNEAEDRHNDKDAPAHTDAKGEKKGHHNLEAEMNALFPKAVPNLALSTFPLKPEIESPTYYQKLSDTKTTLKWKGAEAGAVYHVQVATDPNFKWLVKEEQLFNGTSLEVAGLEAGKHYFWRVAGVK